MYARYANKSVLMFSIPTYKRKRVYTRAKTGENVSYAERFFSL